MTKEPVACRYPDCVDSGPEGKCTRWLLDECSGPALEPAALLTTWVSETEAVTEPLYKAPRRLTDAEIGEIWFSARIPGLTETAARALIRAAERRSGAG
jgi:hypothetical protein